MGEKELILTVFIFLNGCSSTGKSSLTKAMQYLSEKPWLNLGIDIPIDAMSVKYIAAGEKAVERFCFVSSLDQEGFPIVKVETGFYGKKVSNSIPKVVKQLVDDGHNLIIDEVNWDKKDLENYTSILKNHSIFFVEVYCKLPVMEKRKIPLCRCP